MIKIIIKYIAHLLLIFLIQVVILNNIYLFNIIHPYIFIIFLFILPFNIPRGWLLIISFFAGITIDIFSCTYGMHTIASVLIGYLRPYLLRSIIGEDIDDMTNAPHISAIGIRSYAIYIIPLVFIYHLVLMFAEVFSFYHFYYTLYKVILNTLFTVVLIFIYELLAFYKKE